MASMVAYKRADSTLAADLHRTHGGLNVHRFVRQFLVFTYHVLVQCD